MIDALLNLWITRLHAQYAGGLPDAALVEF